jgi:hypothetical protein
MSLINPFRNAGHPYAIYVLCRREGGSSSLDSPNLQTERVVAKDNTVAIGDRSWQLEKSIFRHSLAGTTVTISADFHVV